MQDELDGLWQQMQQLFKIYSALLNENRMRMMKSLMEDEDWTISFKEFMNRLDMNPKNVREHVLKLSEAGFLVTLGRGKYHLSDIGSRMFMAAGPAFLKISRILQEEADLQ
ncbi:MAG: winged helix-turn-helix domain-containing protein [archaeon]